MISTPRNFSELVGIFTNLINLALPVLYGLALLVFIWGLAKFIYKSGDEKSHEDGRLLMTWGLIALFVMLSFDAIIYFFYGDFGFSLGNFGSRLPE